MAERSNFINVRVNDEERIMIQYLAKEHANGSKSRLLRELAMNFAALEGDLRMVKVRAIAAEVSKDIRLLTAWLRLERVSFSESQSNYLSDHIDRLEELMSDFSRSIAKSLISKDR